uniref:Uncharacterized protein n=1 Tax=Phage sp. ctXnn1 TaxID=2826749 RepID=A0A8S5NAG3_9VIRU|nr:MAG TPA: hypothetical protein [Phage sp. ctXnn1]
MVFGQGFDSPQVHDKGSLEKSGFPLFYACLREILKDVISSNKTLKVHIYGESITRNITRNITH